VISPRPYQEECRAAVHGEWRKVRKTLVVQPTGTGKTITFSLIAQDIARQGGRVLILCNREQLIQQAREKLQAVTGIEAAVERAGETALGSLSRATVGSVQTLMNISRLDRFGSSHYTHIICDEADQSLADSFQRIFSYFGESKVLGVTATPDRGDKRALGMFYESLAYEYTMSRALAEGFICPIRARLIPLKIGLPDVGGRDWSDLEVGEALAPYIPQIAGHLWDLCRERKLLVFAPLCAISQMIRDALDKVGFRAYYASGECLEDMPTWNQEKRGACMVNAQLLNRGYDCPDIDAVCVLRSTKVRSSYVQMVGRGTRICAGKDHLLLIDFLRHSEHHDICKPAHLLADNAEVAEKMMERAEASDAECAVDAEALEEARQDVVRDREAALAKKLAEQRRKQARLVDPLQFASSVGSEALLNYQPTFEGEKAPPTADQLKHIEDRGLSTADISSAGQAEAIIKAVDGRIAQGFAYPKQIRLLERYGVKHAGTLRHGEAGKIITRIKANGWRLPETLVDLTR
jgi:superfamily II DNA or RNA helicase